jgi:hypothetical protein
MVASFGGSGNGQAIPVAGSALRGLNEQQESENWARRRRDSNSWTPCRVTRFPSVPDRPLPHVSVEQYIGRRQAEGALILLGGGVPKRPNGLASKASEGSRPPWVQIPPPPRTQLVSSRPEVGSGHRIGPAGAEPPGYAFAQSPLRDLCSFDPATSGGRSGQRIRTQTLFVRNQLRLSIR